MLDIASVLYVNHGHLGCLASCVSLPQASTQPGHVSTLTVSSIRAKKFIAAKSLWFADVADKFVLFCSSLLTTASILLVVLTFNTQATFVPSGFVPTTTLSILQRTISALSVTIVSAVIMVAGKRYVFFKLTRGGIRSRRVAVYASPSIGNIAHYLVRHDFELPVLGLLAVWALGLATGLTVGDLWTMQPNEFATELQIPIGLLGGPVSPDSLLLSAFAQLSYVMGSVCTGAADSVGLIKIGGNLQLTSGGPMGIIYYPPLPNFIPNSRYSLPMEPLSSIPPTAQSLTCISAGLGFETGQLWYEGGDTQTLSIIANAAWQSQPYRLNASAIILDGTLQSAGNATEFVPDGTTRPTVMPDDQWALDTAALVCNATQPIAGNCFLTGPSLVDFSSQLNAASYSFISDTPAATGSYWSTALGMAMGAYSSTQWSPLMTNVQTATVTSYGDLLFTVKYGVYILIANILVSVIMLVVVVKLRMASRLGADFINPTRLLLDPLKNRELFSMSLDDTIDVLGNPYMSVSENEFLLTGKPWSEVTLDSL